MERKMFVPERVPHVGWGEKSSKQKRRLSSDEANNPSNKKGASRQMGRKILSPVIFHSEIVIFHISIVIFHISGGVSNLGEVGLEQCHLA